MVHCVLSEIKLVFDVQHRLLSYLTLHIYLFGGLGA